MTNRGILKFVLLGNALHSDQNSGLPKFALLVHALHSEQYPYYDNILYLVTMSYTPLPQGSFIFILQTPYALGRGESSILTLMIIFRVKINVNINIEPRNEVKMFKKWVLGISIFTQKLTRPPLWAKKYSQI